MAKNYSHKRDAIFNLICSTKSHPTAEWVYSRLKPEYPELSLGTVYRNITMFKQEGMIRSVGVIDGEERFDGDISDHSHFVCEICGQVTDIDCGGEISDNMIAEKNSVKITRRELTFYGKCKECISKGFDKDNG